MRISTNTMYQAGITKINQLQSDQAKLQLQISTGKRILSPADDPVAAARVLELSYAQGINTKFDDNRRTAEIKLNNVESNLTSVTDLLLAAQSKVIASGNATYSDRERASLAGDLQNSLQALLGLANTKDASGNYLYSGFVNDTAPFVDTASSATFVGDSNEQLLQVDSGRQMAINVTGDSIFQGNGDDVFKTFKDFITLLNTPITNTATRTAFEAGVSTAIGGLQKTLDNVLNTRAIVGSRLNEIEALRTSSDDRDLLYTQNLSALQDLDYAQALSDLSKNQTILEAAQKSYVQTTALTLFAYI